MIVAEGTRMVLGPRSLVQQLGDALYRVHGRFKVSFGAVEAAVEGTRFVVHTPDGVDVLAGRVRVSGAGGSVVGPRGHHVPVAGDTPGEPVPLTPEQRRGVRPLGRMLAMSTRRRWSQLVSNQSSGSPASWPASCPAICPAS